MLRSLSFLRHHLYMVCYSKAGEWTRKQQSLWPATCATGFDTEFLLVKLMSLYDSFLCQILFYSALFLSTHCRCRGLLLHLTTLTKTHTDTRSVGRLWTRDWPVAETSTWKHTTFSMNKTSMPPAGFKATIPVSGRVQTHALDSAKTGIGLC
jgi:hypothetical protein